MGTIPLTNHHSSEVAVRRLQFTTYTFILIFDYIAHVTYIYIYIHMYIYVCVCACVCV